jgi:hypothetical protein
MATDTALTSPVAKGKRAAPKSKLAGSYEQKKLQAVIGFHILTIQSEGGGSTLASREAGMVASFLGQDGKLNQVRECLEGRGVYSSLWEDPAGNGKKMLVSTLSGGKQLESGVAFTQTSLCQKKHENRNPSSGSNSSQTSHN